MSTAMMAIDTKSSISVNPSLRRFIPPLFFRPNAITGIIDAVRSQILQPSNATSGDA